MDNSGVTANNNSEKRLLSAPAAYRIYLSLLPWVSCPGRE